MQKENTKLNLTEEKRPTPPILFQEKKLEANQVFPVVEKSAFKSSDYPESFDFPWNPDPLARGNNYQIYDEMKHDDQVKSSISTKKDIVLSTGWEIKCENEGCVP